MPRSNAWQVVKGLLAIPQIVFLLLAIVTAGFYLLHNNMPFNINTDLKDLSPQLTENVALRTAINQLSKSIEGRFVIMLSADSPDLLDSANSDFLQAMADVEQFNIVESGPELVDKISLYFKPYRFNLLTEEQHIQLTQQSPEQILYQAKKNLYQLSGSLRILPINEDPLGWYGDYLLAKLTVQSNSDTGDEFIERKDNTGVTRYYKPITINIAQGALELKSQQQMMESIDSAEKELRQRYPQIEILHSGVFFFAAKAAQASKFDIGLISIGSLVGITFLLLFAFRSLWPLVLPFVSIAVGVGFAFAVIHSLFGSIHIITIVFGASLIGIVIDYSLHYFYHQANPANTTKQARASLHKALLLSLATSVIGYGALGFSSMNSLRQVALFSALGLVAAWLCVVAIAPFTTPKPTGSNNKQLPALLTVFITPLDRLVPFARYLPGTIVALFIFVFFYGIPVSDSPRAIFTLPADLLKQDQLVGDINNDFEPGKYLVANGANTQAVYDQLSQVRLLNQSVNAHSDYVAVDDWIPSPNQQQANYNALAAVYRPDGIASELLMSLKLSPDLIRQLTDEYKAQVNAKIEPDKFFKSIATVLPSLWLTIDGQHYSFVLIRRGTDTSNLAQQTAQMSNVDFIDTAAMATTALKHQRQSAAAILLAAFVLVGGLLLLRYRNLFCLWMLAVPLSSILLTLLALITFGHPLTLFHVMALYLVLGLGMDYVIFIAELDDIEQTTLIAVLLSALTSLLSFGLLSLSSLNVVNAFGLTVLIGNSCNLFGAIIYARSLNRRTAI